MPPDCLVLVLMRDGERWVFVCDDDPQSRGELLRTLGRYAADPELSLSWYDAAVLSLRLQRLAADGATG